MTERINWYGTYVLIQREFKRFISLYNQTIFTPVISALIFLLIFVLIGEKSSTYIYGIKFINFVGYGLIIMSIIQNAFANSSSSFFLGKELGYIWDILTPPFSGIEIVIAFTVGAICRGICVGIMVSIVLIPFIDYTLYHPFLLIIFVFIACSIFGQFGILSAILANSFEQNATISTYIIMPLSFLSGTFFSVKKLPYFFQQLNIFNPFFYIIDGFRYCFTDYTDSNLIYAVSFLAIFNILLFILLLKLINIGWRLKG